MIDQIAEALDAVAARGCRAVRIEIGEAQARALADELNEAWYLQQRLGFTWDNTAREPIEWGQIVRPNSQLFGVRVQGVESPDYLNVVAGE